MQMAKWLGMPAYLVATPCAFGSRLPRLAVARACLCALKQVRS
ncbi:hypothetical protein [Pseudochelatococcus sp. G4_1912]